MAVRRGSGDGSIFKENGRYVACIDVSNGSGGRVRRKRRVRTYAEARTALRELQEEARKGVLGAGHTTVATYLEDWLTHVLPARNVTIATTENYSVIVHKHIVPAIGALRLNQLRAEHVDEMLRSMAASGKARSTIRLARTVLVLALTHAERRDLVGRNAARLAILPPAPTRESRSLTADQARDLLKAAKGDHLEAAWVVGLLLGLRPGELFALRWEDVDFDAGVLHVRQAIKRAGGNTFALGEPKTRTSRRSLDMPAMVAEALSAHRAAQAAERLTAGPSWQDGDLVFCTQMGGMLDPANTRRAFRRLTKTAGLGPWHPHVPLEQIADVAGHAPGSRMTGGVYRQQVTPSVGAARPAMDRLFGADASPA